MLVTFSPLYPILIVARKARSLPLEWSHVKEPTLVCTGEESGITKAYSLSGLDSRGRFLALPANIILDSGTLNEGEGLIQLTSLH